MTPDLPDDIAAAAAEVDEACAELELVAGILVDNPNASQETINQAVVTMRMVRAGMDVSTFCPPELLQRVRAYLSYD